MHKDFPAWKYLTSAHHQYIHEHRAGNLTLGLWFSVIGSLSWPRRRCGAGVSPPFWQKPVSSLSPLTTLSHHIHVPCMRSRLLAATHASSCIACSASLERCQTHFCWCESHQRRAVSRPSLQDQQVVEDDAVCARTACVSMVNGHVSTMWILY